MDEQSGGRDSLPAFLLRALVVAVIGLVVISTLSSVGSFLGAGSEALAYPGDDPNVVDTRIRSVPGSVDVAATTGSAALLSDGETVRSPGPSGYDDDAWAACATGALSDGANPNATYDLWAYNSSSILVQYDAGEWSAYHSNGTHSAKATVPAPSPRDLTPVCARLEGGELVVAADGTYSAPANMTTATESRNVSLTWNGTLDEVQLYGNSSPNATLDAYMTDPVEPRPEADRVARFMLDEGSGSATTVYWLNATATNTGGWAQGVQNPSKWLGLASSIERGDDYELYTGPFRVEVLAGGYLEGAPVVHVSWTGAGPFSFDLMGLVVLFIALMILLVFANRVTSALGGRV
jgi:hypothetical protein